MTSKLRDIGAFNRMVMSATPNRRQPSKLPTSLQEAAKLIEGLDATLKYLEELKSELERGEEKDHE